MDKETLFESLIVWLDTFNVDVPHGSAEQLSDGICMSRVLNEIAPDYFNDGWLNKIKTEDVTNWRLKVSNLKKILKGILEYNLEVLGIQIHDFQMPDVNAIGEHNDHGELGRLLQLILGCAVNCSKKQEYIQKIMDMEESMQHVVMTAIQELMTKEINADMDSEVGEQLKRTVEELNCAIEAKEELMQRCHELDLQVTALVEEKQNLSFENEKLSERLNQAENLDDPSTPAGKRFHVIQQQLEQCQEENYKLESAKDDYRIKVEVLQKEKNELLDKNSELTGLADECRGLKDELDDLRHTAEQVVRYEAQIESYKKKMDELSDLRGQVKLLEDKNTKYMQENLELQEDIRKSGAVKQQLEVYKRQVHELQSKLTEETKRADKAEFEGKRMHEKVSTLQREKERVMIERDSLKELNEELQCRPSELRIVTERDSLREVNEELNLTQSQHVGSGGGDDLSTASQMEMLSLPPEIKEKMLRLEHENKMLKIKSSGDSDEQAQVLQTMLDDANSRKNELETELRLAGQKNMELEAHIEDLQEMAKSTVSNSEMIELRKKLDEQVLLTQQKDKIVQKERDSMSDLHNQMVARNEEVEKLRDKIEKKEEEKRVMEERYKKYFDKARAVINNQEAKLKSTGNHYPDVQALKQQMVEKDKLIEQLQKEQEKSKVTFEQEEKMMVSAWYNLGIQLHRQAAIDRLENSQGQAFLSRQRQAHLRGQQRIPNSHNNPSSDPILTSDPSHSTNQQEVAEPDGCFASMFDYLLWKLQNEVTTKSGISSIEVQEVASPAVIHSHLLAGLLGENPQHSPSDIPNTGHSDSTPHTSKSHQHNVQPEIIPDTPELVNKSCKRLKFDKSDLPFVTSFANFTDNAEDNMSDFKVSENNQNVDNSMDLVTDTSDPVDAIEKANDITQNTNPLEPGPVLSDVHLDESESQTDIVIDIDAIDEAIDITENTNPLEPDLTEVHLDESLCQTDVVIDVEETFAFIEKAAEEHYQLADTPSDINATVDTDLEDPDDVPSQDTATDERHPLTPIKQAHVNTPVYLQSPFIKNISTECVTKRRSRNKRKRNTNQNIEKENYSDNTTCNDTLGTSELSVSGHID